MANYNLGHIYEYGIYNQTKDPKKSLEYYKAASDKGMSKAMVKLGSTDCEYDPIQAARLFEHAANLGDPEGLHSWGTFLNHYSNEANPDLSALEYYKKKTSSKADRSGFASYSRKKRLIIDNNTIQLLINSIDQKFSTCCVDTDFPIVIDTMINAAADLTLAKCEEAQKSLLAVSQVTDNVKYMSDQLEGQANDICSQADSTLSQMKSIEKKINDVLYPKTSLFVKIVSSLLSVITSLFNLFQIGIGKIEGESDSDDEKSPSDN